MSHALAAPPLLDEREEQARRAVKAFRALQPTLTAFARVLTRDQKVRVEMSKDENAATDGKRIFMRPPMALGATLEHNRSLCDHRDADQLQRCLACRVREDVLVHLYHEIAHIAFDTFAQPTDADKAELIKRAVANQPGRYAERIQAKLESLPPHQTSSYMRLTGFINEFLPMIYNGLEDARINAAQFKGRPGTKVMFEASTYETFRTGVEQRDPMTGDTVVIKWMDYPQNSQVIIGLFCKASGYDMSDYLIPPVVEALADEELTRLVSTLQTIRSTQGVYELTFPVLARLHELGFCKSQEEPEDEPDDGSGGSDSEESEPSDDGSNEGDDANSDGPGDDDDQAERDNDSRDQSDPEDGDVDDLGSGSSTESDEDGVEDGQPQSREEGRDDVPPTAPEGDSSPDGGDESSPAEAPKEGAEGSDDSSGESSHDDSAAGVRPDSPAETSDADRPEGSGALDGDEDDDTRDPSTDPGEADPSTDDGSADEGSGEASSEDQEPDSGSEGGGSDSEGDGSGTSDDSADGSGSPEGQDDRDSDSDSETGDGVDDDDLADPSRGDAGSGARGGDAPGQADPTSASGSPEDSSATPEAGESDKAGDEASGGESSGSESGGGDPKQSGGDSRTSTVGLDEDDSLERPGEGSVPEDSADVQDGSDGDSSEMESADSADRGGSSSGEMGKLEPVPGDVPDGDSERKSPESDASGRDDTDDLIDSGADDGTGGVELKEHSSWDHVPMGTAEEAETDLEVLQHGGPKPPEVAEQERRDAELIDRTIIQGLYFETPSRHIYGVRHHRYGQPVMVDGMNFSRAWAASERGERYAAMVGARGDYQTPESILGGALLKMRVAFSDNAKAKMENHRKSGKVNARVLGKRAPAGDERLFKQKRLPGKRDYFVCIWLDVSGSTAGTNIDLIKRACFAQATLLHRMGIKFAIYAGSGNFHNPTGGRVEGLDLDVYIVKEADDPWSEAIQGHLAELGPDSANLDGHNLEYARKRCDERRETDKVILYFSDGKMPAENHDEELEILQREIATCKRRQITLLGVGIRTDSPARHGLDTVQIDEVEDLPKVIQQLGKYLAVKR